jgi:hypothetical protein
MLLLLETIIFSIAIWVGLVKIKPESLKSRVITLQIGVHLTIGLLMGLGYTLV